MPRKNDLAVCSRGTLGLITDDSYQGITYADGSEGMGWVGIHLTDQVAPIGSPWCSHAPRVVGHLRDLLDKVAPVPADKYPGITISSLGGQFFAKKRAADCDVYLQEDGTWYHQCTRGWFWNRDEIERLLGNSQKVA